MAMIECPECGRKISNRAEVCPGCGISQELIQELLAGKEKQGTTTASKENVKDVLLEKKSKVTLSSMRCSCCNTVYSTAEHLVCPNCSYPLLSFRNNEEDIRGEIKEYRKAAGIQVPDSILSLNRYSSILKLNVGDFYQFGNYQGEEIIWRVLAVENGKALLISDKGLDAKPYNNTFDAVTWETCNLRRWLNNEFLTSSFDASEQERIAVMTVTADVNLQFRIVTTDSGKDTKDKIFLLSIQEAEKYFATDKDRKVYLTASAKKNGAYEDSSSKYGRWWLRSPGVINKCAAIVSVSGACNGGGLDVDCNDNCIRPALWLELNPQVKHPSGNIFGIENMQKQQAIEKLAGVFQLIADKKGKCY